MPFRQPLQSELEVAFNAPIAVFCNNDPFKSIESVFAPHGFCGSCVLLSLTPPLFCISVSGEEKNESSKGEKGLRRTLNMFSIGQSLDKSIPSNVELRPSLGLVTTMRLVAGDVRFVEDVLVRHTNEYEDQSLSASPTSHGSCGYGYDLFCLITLRPPNCNIRFYAAVDYWSGCLSYDQEDRECRLWYSDDLADLLDTALDADKRQLVIDHQSPNYYNQMLTNLQYILPNPIPLLLIMPFLSFGLFV
jgi:hypothetical protein